MLSDRTTSIALRTFFVLLIPSSTTKLGQEPVQHNMQQAKSPVFCCCVDFPCCCSTSLLVVVYCLGPTALRCCGCCSFQRAAPAPAGLGLFCRFRVWPGGFAFLPDGATDVTVCGVMGGCEQTECEADCMLSVVWRMWRSDPKRSVRHILLWQGRSLSR